MKRDMDLVRAILMEVEKDPAGYAPDINIEGYSAEQVAYHAHIMGQAGLVEVDDTSDMGSKSPEALVKSLTWEGHEFLDAAREPSRWQQAKVIMDKAGGAGIQIWVHVLTDLIKERLGL